MAINDHPITLPSFLQRYICTLHDIVINRKAIGAKVDAVCISAGHLSY
jgi:hypothetical protein